MPSFFSCPCGGQVVPGGHAPAGGGQCLTCGRVYVTTQTLLAAGGSSAIVCDRGRSRRMAKCQVPDCGHEMVALCDEPDGHGTCDFKMCSQHRTQVGNNRDRCPKHAAAAAIAGDG
jgi:hypothetical protein